MPGDDYSGDVAYIKKKVEKRRQRKVGREEESR
jgi:hypothetical protein